MIGEDLIHRHVVAHRGVGAVGVHRVDPDAELAELDRQRIGQPDNAELRGAVVPTAGDGLDPGR